MIRLVALDIDGTLTNIPAELSERNVEAIKNAQEHGIFVTIATGRGFFGSSMIAERMHINGPMIIYGGALTVHSETGETLQGLCLPEDAVREVLDYAAELGVHAQIYQDDQVVVEKDNPFFARYCARLALPHRIDSTLRHWERYRDIPKILVMVEPEAQAHFRALFDERFGDVLQITTSQPGYVEINNRRATKGQAVAALAEKMGLSVDEVCAVGDSYLDTDMIRWAGLGACVADGVPEVKAISDLLIPPCDDNGVAWLLDSLSKGIIPESYVG